MKDHKGRENAETEIRDSAVTGLRFGRDETLNSFILKGKVHFSFETVLIGTDLIKNIWIGLMIYSRADYPCARLPFIHTLDGDRLAIFKCSLNIQFFLLAFRSTHFHERFGL